VHGLRGVLPEVENLVRISQVGQRIPLLRVEEIWELNRIVDEENRGVVANHIVIAFLGVEFDSEASGISNQIFDFWQHTPEAMH
jgi:hypothetical protein